MTDRRGSVETQAPYFMPKEISMDENDKKWASTLSEGCTWIKEHVPNLTIDELLFLDKIESECCKILFERQEGE